jgi:hypothetical protein
MPTESIAARTRRLMFSRILGTSLFMTGDCKIGNFRELPVMSGFRQVRGQTTYPDGRICRKPRFQGHCCAGPTRVIPQAKPKSHSKAAAAELSASVALKPDFESPKSVLAGSGRSIQGRDSDVNRYFAFPHSVNAWSGS